DRERQAILSVSRLVPEGRRKQFTESISPLAARLETAAATAPAPAAGASLAGAASIVVKRKRIGTIPLDELAPDQREGFPSGAWDLVPITALYWCDGHRNLAEVIRLTQLE